MTPNTNCPHKQANHTHGTYSCYVLDKCHCTDCKRANRDYMRNLTRTLAVEKWNPDTTRYVDGDIVRAHLHHLMDAGMGSKRIAAAAGYAGTGTISTILWGKYVDQPLHPEHRPPRHRVRREVAERLLAVQLDLADGTPIDGTGTARRLQALVAIGWSGSRLAHLLGCNRSNFTPILHGRRDTTRTTANAVRALYDQLWDTPPPQTSTTERQSASRARNMAQANGWPPPAAWDDDDSPHGIDNPHATPWTDETPRRPGLARRWHADDVEFLLDDGLHPGIVADRVGVKLSTLVTTLRREERDDLADRLNVKTFENRPATTRTHRRGTAA